MVCFSMSLPHAVAAGGADSKSKYVDGSSSTAAISNESLSLNDVGSGCCHNGSGIKSSSDFNDLDDSSRPPRLCSLSQSMLSLSRRSGIASSASSATHTTGNSSKGYYSATTKHADNSRLKMCSASSVEDSSSGSSAARISRSANINCGPKTVDGAFGLSLSAASSKSLTANKKNDKQDIERYKTNENPEKSSREQVQDEEKDCLCHTFNMMGLVQKRDDDNAENKVPELMESPTNHHRRRRVTELIHVPPSDTGSPALLFADDIIACTVTFPTVITLKTDDETNALCSLSSPSGLNDFLINNSTHPEHDDDACSYASDVSDVTSDLFQLRPSPSQRTRCESEEAKDDNEVDVNRDTETSRRNNDDDDSSVDASSQSSKSSKSTTISIRSGSDSSILSSNDSESILFSSVEDSDDDNDVDHRRRRRGARNATMESLALDKKFRLREKQLRRVSSGNKAYCAYLRKQEEKVRLMETSRLMMRHSMSFGANDYDRGSNTRRSNKIMSAAQRRMSESHLFLGRVATSTFHSNRDLGNTVSNLLDLSGSSAARRQNTATTTNQLSAIASSSEELLREEEEEIDDSTNEPADSDAGEKKTLLSLMSSLQRLLLLWMFSFFQGLSLVVSRQYRNIVDMYQFERYHTFPGICAIILYCVAHTSIYNSIASLHGFIFSSDSPHSSYEYFVLLLTFFFGVGLCRICGGIFNWLSDTMYEGVKFDLHNRFRLGLLDAKLTSWIRKRRMLCQCMDLLGFYLCFMVVSRLIEDHMMPYVCHSPAKGMHLLEQLPSRNKDNLSLILHQTIPGWVHDDYDVIIKQQQIASLDPASSPTATAAMISKSSKEWQSLFSTYFSDATTTSPVQPHSCSAADASVAPQLMDDKFCSKMSDEEADEEDEEDEEDLDDDDDDEDDDGEEEEEQTLEQVQQLLDEADMEYLYTKLSTYSFTAMYGWGADIVPLVTQQRFAIYYVILSATSVAALVYMGVGFSME